MVVLLPATTVAVVVVDMMVVKQLEGFSTRLSERPAKELLAREHSLPETLSC